MKKDFLTVGFLATLFLVSPVCLAGDGNTTPTTPTTPTNPPSGQPSDGEVIPIIVIKEQPIPILHAPSRGIPITLETTCRGLRFDLPFEEYPIVVSVMSEYGFGYWTATFMDVNSCEMPFDGTVGDYKLTLTTSGNSTYTGYFTLE